MQEAGWQIAKKSTRNFFVLFFVINYEFKCNSADD